MKRTSSIIWGIVLICIGVVFALNALDITDISIFFAGWWTLFIIIPCGVGVITSKDKVDNLIGVLIGVVLLLGCQDVISFGMIWKLAIPAVIVVIGLKMIFGKSSEDRKHMKEFQNIKPNGTVYNGTATFSGQNINFDGQLFQGAELNAVFGGIKLDLRNAVIERNCAINASAIFGGIDIFVPQNVNVITKSNSLFGGISNKNHINSNENAVTLFIEATCMFGGVEIK